MSPLILVLLFSAQAAELSSSAAAPAAPAPTSAPDTVNGLYPLWEQTGVVHDRGTIQIGYQHAQLGLGPVQIGTAPYLDLYGTLNLELKLRLYAGPTTALALTVGSYHVPTQAESRSIGNLHPTGFANPYDPVWVFPASLALSHAVTPWLHLHTSSTVLLTRANSQSEISVGQAAVAELRAGPVWRALVHAGVEGVGVDTQEHVGLSFAYRSRYLSAGAGYARRFSHGEAGHVIMFDGALVLP